MKNRKHEFYFMLLVSFLLLTILINSLIFFFRIDMSQNQAYSILPFSRQVITTLTATVRVTYYLSETLRKQKSEISEIIDILNEYSQNSSGKVIVQMVDPDDKDVQIRMHDLGIQAQQSPVVVNNKIVNSLVYSGILIEYLGTKAVLPLINSPESIEYQITVTLQGFIHQQKRVLGILIGGSGQDLDSQFTMLGQLFDKDVEVRFLKSGEAIPADVSALFVLGDQGLGLMDALHIDQFLMAGKGVLIGDETVGVGLTNTWVPVPHKLGILSMLLEHYGIHITKGWVLDDSNYTFPAKDLNGEGEESLDLPYPAWIQSLTPNVNSQNLVSARSVGLDLLWSSPLELKSGTSGQLLVSSSPRSWVMKSDMVADPDHLGLVHLIEMKNKSQEHRSFGLAAAVEGSFASYFQGKSNETLFPGSNLPPLIQETNNGKLLAIGSASFASDLYQVLIQNGLIAQPKNIIFLQNSLDWLTGNTELLKLRTRPMRDERLTKIENDAIKDTLGTAVFLLNALIIPLLIGGFGIGYFLRRKKSSQNRDQNAA